MEFSWTPYVPEEKFNMQIDYSRVNNGFVNIL